MVTLGWSFSLQASKALTVGQLLLERIVPVWGIPSELPCDRGAHFTGQVIKSICHIWPMHFHCSYHPQSSGLVERNNGSVKTQLAKLSEAFGLS